MHIGDKYFEWDFFSVSIHDKQFHKVAWSHASFKMCHSQTTPLRHQHIEHQKQAYWWQVIFFGNPCIKWVRYFIILTIIWLSGVLWTSSDHQSDPIVTKAFQNPDGNCPSIYTQSKHYLSTIGSKLHHRKTIWPILDRMKFLELPNFTTVLPNFHRVVN